MKLGELLLKTNVGRGITYSVGGSILWGISASGLGLEGPFEMLRNLSDYVFSYEPFEALDHIWDTFTDYWSHLDGNFLLAASGLSGQYFSIHGPIKILYNIPLKGVHNNKDGQGLEDKLKD